MSLVNVKPTSPGRRSLVRVSRDGLYKGRPHKSLIRKKKAISGRNCHGRITVRHRGGGHKRFAREVDFIRSKDSIPAKVERIEYDPGRSAHIALLCYRDGERRYILAPKKVKVGDILESGVEAPIRPGNCLPILNIPLGSLLHCLEMEPGSGAKVARSAGSFAVLMAKEGFYAQVKMVSGEIRRFHVNCRAVIGEVGNSEHALASLGKAGAKRWRGKRPTVRGVAMNPVDHPHGGGEGRTSGGRHPCSPWGVLAKGYRTRRNKRTSGMIVSRRKK